MTNEIKEENVELEEVVDVEETAETKEAKPETKEKLSTKAKRFGGKVWSGVKKVAPYAGAFVAGAGAAVGTLLVLTRPDGTEAELAIEKDDSLVEAEEFIEGDAEIVDAE